MNWGKVASAAMSLWSSYKEWRADRRRKAKKRTAADLDRIRTEAGTKAKWEGSLSEQARRARDRAKSPP
jgi:hypothetical protein